MPTTIHHVWLDETSDGSRRILHCDSCETEWNLPASIDAAQARQIGEWHVRTGQSPHDLFWVRDIEDPPPAPAASGEAFVYATPDGAVWAFTCATCLAGEFEAPRRAVTIMEGYALCEDHLSEATNNDDAGMVPMHHVGVVPQEDGGEVDVFLGADPPVRFNRHGVAYGGWWIDRDAADVVRACLQNAEARVLPEWRDPDRITVCQRAQRELSALIEAMDGR
jgi:hypothetical protein